MHSPKGNDLLLCALFRYRSLDPDDEREMFQVCSIMGDNRQAHGYLCVCVFVCLCAESRWDNDSVFK